MQMLTDEMVAEVVAYDRRRREAYKRRTGEKMRRVTERYNYIVPCDGKVKSLSEVQVPGHCRMARRMGMERPEAAQGETSRSLASCHAHQPRNAGLRLAVQSRRAYQGV